MGAKGKLLSFEGLLALMKWGFPVISVRRAGRAGEDYWKKSGSLPGKEGSRDAADERREIYL